PQLVRLASYAHRVQDLLGLVADDHLAVHHGGGHPEGPQGREFGRVPAVVAHVALLVGDALIFQELLEHDAIGARGSRVDDGLLQDAHPPLIYSYGVLYIDAFIIIYPLGYVNLLSVSS